MAMVGKIQQQTYELQQALFMVTMATFSSLVAITVLFFFPLETDHRKDKRL